MGTYLSLWISDTLECTLKKKNETLMVKGTCFYAFVSDNEMMMVNELMVVIIITIIIIIIIIIIE